MVTKILSSVVVALSSVVFAGPNVVIVMTDDQGYSDMSCHGHPILLTPNLDALSSQSVRLTDFHVDPFCAPTRAALMTGRMSQRTGTTSTYGLRNLLRKNETLMPAYFKASGYRTALFGKWHLGGNYPYRPIDRGFDEWLGLGNGGLAIADDLWDNDRMNDRYWHNGEIVSRKGFSTDVYFDSAMAFMRSCTEEGKPFFTYLATNVPHRENNVPSAWMKPFLKKGCHKDQASFYAGITRVDWNLGRLMAFLDEEGLSENTILIFMTDNGTIIPLREPNSHVDTVSGMKGKKGDVYDGGHRVPCFIKGPEKWVGAPRDIPGLTAHLDLLPTFQEICGLDNPEGKDLPLDGRSLTPLLTGNGMWGERTLFLHHQNGVKGPKKYIEVGVLTPDWRLIFNKKGQPELYRIKDDPSQLKNVAAEYPEVLERLRGEYDVFWGRLDHDRPLERPVLSGQAVTKLSSGWQRHVREGNTGWSGTWAMEVAEAGAYRFEVRRWPREAGKVAMTAGLPAMEDPDIEYVGNRGPNTPGIAFDVKTVELEISGQPIQTKNVKAGEEAVTFDIDLPRGAVDLRTSLVLANKKKKGPSYVYVTKL